MIIYKNFIKCVILNQKTSSNGEKTEFRKYSFGEINSCNDLGVKIRDKIEEKEEILKRVLKEAKTAGAT